MAVFLGVAFLAGTLVLSDTLNSSIDRFYVQAFIGTDVTVRNATSVSDRPGALRGMIDRSLVGRIEHVQGVAVAEPVIQGSGQLLDKNGKTIPTLGPRIAGNWITVPALNPYHIVEGRAPRPTPAGYPEVVIDRKAASQGHLRVGDRIGVLTPEQIKVKIVGIAKFGSQDAFGGGSFTAFTLADAQRFIAKSPGKITSIAVKADPGVSQDQLRRQIQAVLPPGVQAITGQALAQENLSITNKAFLNVFRIFLLTFAAVALLVGIFTIYNTFSIVVAQRARESALLRTIGASQGQVLTSVVVEGLAIALVASIAGLGGGLIIGILLKGLFSKGFGVPISGLVFTPVTGTISVGVGVVVTLLACLLPAARASRVPPLAALRDATVESTGTSRTRIIAGGLLMSAGVCMVVASLVTGSSAAMPLVGLGALGTFVGMVTLGPAAAKPASAILGAPGARLRGVAGRLARQNAMRTPRRTAGAATALMLGLGVVTLFAVLAASLSAGLNSSIAKTFAADLVVSSGNNQTAGFSPSLTDAVARLPQVARATGIGSGTVLINGKSSSVSIVSPDQLGRLLRLTVTSGSLQRLSVDQLAVSKTRADANHWKIGTPVRVKYADGTTDIVTIGALYSSDSTLREYLMPAPAWRAHDAQALDSLVMIKVRDGIALSRATQAVTRAVKSFGAPTVQTRQEYIDAQTAGVRTLLYLAYGMLAFAIFIALMGIGNTLSLSTYERTRELGLLRAVGATRRQLRMMVRWESLIVALFGTLAGLVVGLFVGWGLATAISQGGVSQFAVPIVPLLIIVVVGAIAGVLAAIRPASRAARLNILNAIATE
jgi:putative ABC transport system permease protein